MTKPATKFFTVSPQMLTARLNYQRIMMNATDSIIVVIEFDGTSAQMLTVAKIHRLSSQQQ